VSCGDWRFQVEEAYSSTEEEPLFKVMIQGSRGGYGTFDSMTPSALQAFFDTANAVCRIEDKSPKLERPQVRQPAPVFNDDPTPEVEIVARTLAVEKGLRILALTWKVEKDVSSGTPRAELVFEDVRADVVPFVDGVWCWTAGRQSGTAFSFKTAMLSASEIVINELESRAGDAGRRLGGDDS
jgi:hypothetical protein